MWPRGAHNHLAQNAPFYAAAYAAPPAVPPAAPPELLRVLSYNIFYARNVTGAIDELRELQAEQPLDILLLQEMDEAGVDQIAQALALNYVYYPSAVVRRHNRNFGNAVLARWPLSAPAKLILPHRSLTTRMIRTATRAQVRVGARTVVAVSAHTETVFTLPAFRRAQYRALRDASPLAAHVVVGGDFNTFSAGGIRTLEHVFAYRGFQRVPAAGHTLAKYGVKVTADHIFSRGFAVVDAGAHAAARASDHLPLWAHLAFV
jgi:endonuclease/exonuclease/phosphatase family metal-dependent hydrolase